MITSKTLLTGSLLLCSGGITAFVPSASFNKRVGNVRKDNFNLHVLFSQKNDEAQKAYNTIVEEELDELESRMKQKRENKLAKNTEIRKKLIAESIAPWRTLRLFLYAALGSGAAVGGFITAAGVAAAFSGVRTDLDLNTELVNLGIDFGAAVAFAIFAKLDIDKGKELDQDVEAKIEKKLESRAVSREMQKRAQELGNLKLNIRVSADGQKMTEAPIKVLQTGARQHVIIVAGPRKAVKDALLGANLMKLEDFAMSNVLVVPYELDDKNSLVRPSGGFGDRPVWETRPYVAEPVGEGWDEYIQAEMNDAIKQSGSNAKEDGIAIVVGNNGQVIRRGVGMVPWRQTVEQLTQLNAKPAKDD